MTHRLALTVLLLFLGATGGATASAQAPDAPPRPATRAPDAATPAAIPASALAAPSAAIPLAQPREFREVLHGVEVSDPYRWLEDLASPESQDYFRAQGLRARDALAAIPGRDRLLARIRELSGAGVSITQLVLAGGDVFYLKSAPGLATPVLCVRDGFAGKERVLVDPAAGTKDGVAGAILWHHPSPDGRHVAYGLAAAGTEDTTLRVVEVATARDAGVAITRTRFNDSLGWHHDSRAFYYAHIPEGGPGDAPHRFAGIRVHRHVLGRPAARDETVFASGMGGARDVPETVFPSILVPEDSTHAYAIARHGVRREIAVYVATVRELAMGLPRWTKIIDPADGVTAIEAWRDDLYMLTHRDAPNYRVDHAKVGKAGMSRPRTIVPQGDTVILDMGLAADALYLRTSVGGLERLERLNFGLGASRTPEFVKTAFDVAITQLLTNPRRRGAVLRTQGFIEAPAIFTVEAKSGDLRNTGLQPAPVADFSAMDEVRLYAPGHDGAKIPVTLLYRRTTMLSADNPTLLIGFGAYGQSQVPTYDPTRLAWLERGGIIAYAHIRGGGEYGEAWHLAGQKANKETTILDMIACAEFLIRYGFTSPKRLAVMGTSAGAIPAAGAVVRRPELFAAAVPRAAVLDMLRYETGALGPSNVPEFGSTATEEGFRWLRAISAYQQVKDGTPYPGVLLTTGMGGPRAEPWHAGKMAARLQAASSSGKPVLLRVDWQGGDRRVATRARRDEELADIYAFLFWQFGDPDFAPAPRGGVADAAPVREGG